MPISREVKEERVARLAGLLEESTGFAIVRTQGLPVARVQNIRRKILAAGGKYVVSKNTLLIKALEQVGWSVPPGQLKGPTAIAFGKNNFPAVAKALLNVVKDEGFEAPFFEVVGGVMGGKEILDPARLEAVSNLPSLEELRAQLIGLIVSPATGLVTVLDGGVGNIVNVLQAYLDDKKAS